jgi:hypothetical protein
MEGLKMKIKDKGVYKNGTDCHEYEVITSIPKGFFVWNIGDNMVDGYIPIAEELSENNINPYTLKAIKLNDDDIQILRNAAHWGVNNLVTCQKALKSRRKGFTSDKKRYHATKSIEIFKRLTEV